MNARPLGVVINASVAANIPTPNKCWARDATDVHTEYHDKRERAIAYHQRNERRPTPSRPRCEYLLRDGQEQDARLCAQGYQPGGGQSKHRAKYVLRTRIG